MLDLIFTKDSYTMKVVFCSVGCGGLLFEVKKEKLWYCFACGAFNYHKQEIDNNK